MGIKISYSLVNTCECMLPDHSWHRRLPRTTNGEYAWSLHRRRHSQSTHEPLVLKNYRINGARTHGRRSRAPPKKRTEHRLILTADRKPGTEIPGNLLDSTQPALSVTAKL